MDGHDELADLHSWKDFEKGLIHPHTEEGYLFMLSTLDEAQMAAYDADGTNPMLSLETLDRLLSDADLLGLSIQESASQELYDAMVAAQQDHQG